MGRKVPQLSLIHIYSLDAYSWLDNYALEHSRSQEDILLEREEMTTRLYLIAALPVALAHATPTQARRVHAYYIVGIKQPEISRIEGVDVYKRQAQQSADISKKRRRLAAAQKRAGELEKLICKIYEDNALGKLPDARYRACLLYTSRCV